MKRFFFRGLGAVLPLTITAFIFYWVFDLLYSVIGVPLGNLLHWVVGKINTEWASALGQSSWLFPAVGFVVGVFLVFLVGFFVATFLGKKLMKLAESLFRQLPVIRVIYPYAKQFSDFLFSGEDQKRVQFKTPVAFPFPAYGLYSIGFVTSDGLRTLNEAAGKHFVCIFVPTAPTPFTGFIVYVPREEIIPLPITVEEAMRMFISAGVLAPPHQVSSLSDFLGGARLPLPAEKKTP